MLAHPLNSQRSNQLRHRDNLPQRLRICWTNVGRRSPCHTAILEAAWDHGIDVICIQEPFTASKTRTSTHPGYTHYAPVEAWDDPTERESQRPRVMTYVRKGARLKARILYPRISRDLLWVEVNGYSILNVYRQPLNYTTLDHVMQQTPPPLSLVGGDFNVRHSTFEPGSASASGGAELARWAIDNGMDFISEPGQATHQAGHVLDLTFSNIPFAETTVYNSLHCGSDHNTLVTTLLARGNAALEQYHYRIPEAKLPKFAGLVELGMQGYADPRTVRDSAQLDGCITALTDILQEAIKTARKLDREAGRSAPWWTTECSQAYRRHIQSRAALSQTPSEATRAFLTTVRKAKRAYWRDRIDNIQDDKALYKLVAWHKLSDQQDVPLIVDGRSITEPLAKAEALRSEILNRFNADDDLPHLPDLPDLDTTTTQLPWDQAISMEETERNTIGVSSTSPGTDRITVRLLKVCWAHVKDAIRIIY
jgi:hypothetical protein